MFKALQLILALSILVFIHELGHFMWARIFKVGVEKFYMFFDTPQFALLRWNKTGLYLCNLKVSEKANPSDTEYGIGWIPLGGYCAIAGMVDETHSADDIKDMQGDNLFAKKGKFAQFMIMVGGVLNNLILAVIIYIGMSWYWGKDVVRLTDLPYGLTYSEYAHSIGLQEGDEIVAVDGKEVDLSTLHSRLLLANDVTVNRHGSTQVIALPDTMGQVFLRDPLQLELFATPFLPFVIDSVAADSPAEKAGFLAGDSLALPSHTMTLLLQDNAGKTLDLDFYRADSLMHTSITLGEDGMMGVFKRNFMAGRSTHIDYSFLEAIPAGIQRGWTMLYNYVRQFKLVFTKEGAQSLGGFGTMGSIFPESWQWLAFWSMTAFFSVALAFMNILPIPGLDGGHIFILLIEAIIRRPISDKAKERAQYVGMGLIIALMVYVNANDIWKFLIKPFIG
mgnify:CR=1 FL=1